MPAPDLSGKNILIAPLNWGLGHATRCMPLIDLLLGWNANILLAGDGRSLRLLKEEYPDLKALELPAYDVRYTSGTGMVAMTIARSPRYLRAIYREHLQLERYVSKYAIDLVISDNRYGLWSSVAPTVFICHQLAVIPPDFLDWATPLVYRLHSWFFNRFNEVWIPDLEGAQNLSGRLSHQFPGTDKMHFIGAISRFNNMTPPIAPGRRADYIAILSGPEPQRTLLEHEIVAQAKTMEGDFLIVQGKTETLETSEAGNVRTVSFMTSGDLFAAICQAEVVITRSGYSSIMDLHATGSKALLIPTPGQTEQEYLGERLMQAGIAAVSSQSELRLAEGIERAKACSGFPKVKANAVFESAVAAGLQRLLPSVTRN